MQQNDIKTVTLVVNTSQANERVRQLKDQIAQVETLKRQLAQQGDTKGLKEADKSLRNLERQLREATTRGDQLRQTLQHLDQASPKELRDTIRVINKELTSGRVKRGTQEWEALTRQLVAAKTELAAITREMAAQSRGSLLAAGKQLLELANHIGWFAQGLDTAVDYMRRYVEQTAEMKEAESQVIKYTGLTTQEVDALNEKLKALDTRTPRERLNALAADAGRLGITGSAAVLDFVRAADQINLALGADLGEDGVKNIGKLAQLFAPEAPLGESMIRTASLINDLAQSSSASEGYLLDFTARLAGVGRQAGLSQSQIAAFASVLDQSMMGQERAATALSNVITALYRHPQRMAQTAGLDVKAFTELLSRDANAALLQFIGAISRAGNMDSIAPMLDEMKLSGSGVTQTLTVLASQLQKVEATQAQAARAYKQGNSATQEAQKANSTLQAQMEKAQKKAKEYALALGAELAPMMKYAVTTSSLLAKTLLFLIHTIKQHPIALIATTTALVGYTLAVKGAAIAQALATRAAALQRTATAALTIVVQGARFAYFALTGATAQAAVAQRALNTAMAANPWGFIATAVIALIFAIEKFAARARTLTAEQRAQIQVQRDLIDVQKEATRSTLEEKQRIELLNAIVRDNTRTLADRQRALRDLQAIVPTYHGQISKEGQLIRDNAQAIDTYIQKLDKMALAEALYEKIKENAAKQVHADLSVKAWERAIKNRESLMKSKGHESRKDTKTYFTGDGGNTISLEVETNEKRLEDIRQLAHSHKRHEAWKKEQAAIAATDRSLKQYAKDMQLTAQLEAVTLGRSTGSTRTIARTAPEATGRTGGGTSGKGSTTTSPKAQADQHLRQQVEAIKAEAQMRSDLAQLERAKGITDEKTHQDLLLDIQLQAIDRQAALYKEGSAQRIALQREADQVQRRAHEENAAWSLRQIDLEERDQTQAARTAYLRGLSTEERYQQQLDHIKIRALQRRAQLTAQGLGTEHRDSRAAATALAEESARQQLATHKRHQEQLATLRKAYDKQSATDRMKAELAQLEALHRAQLIKEEEYQRLRQAIRGKHQAPGGDIDKERKAAADSALAQARQRATGQEGETHISPTADTLGAGALGAAAARIAIAQHLHDEIARMEREGVITHQQAEDAKTQITAQHYQQIRELATAAFATIGALTGQMAQLNNADRDLELAQIEQHYRRQTEIHGRSSAQSARLEEQKQADIAKVKTKYAQREAKMQIAQAIAQTAVNAISAYGSVVKVPFVGPVLAIAASAAAIAAGAVQIATIRKQAEAQAAGYYEGGFTGGRRYKKQAGVVHEGEFVANHEAVNNPHLLPVFRLIDSAQRARRVASLTAADISAVVTQPQHSAAHRIAHSTDQAAHTIATAHSAQTTAPIIVPTESPRTTQALDRLAEALDRGLTATVALSGRDGLHEQYTRYQQNLQRK